MRNFFKALGILIEKLRDIDFAVIGTFNLFIQGIYIKPHDLDLITDDDGVRKIATIFKSEITEENSYLETEFIVNGVKVHVVSNKNNSLREPFKGGIKEIEIEELKIPCLSLLSELRFYEKADRKKDSGKLELIREKLSEKI